MARSQQQRRIQILTEDYEKLQSMFADVVDKLQRCESLMSEYELVEKEIEQVSPENTIFKMTGPVLVEQDREEAKTNLKTRLVFTRSEIENLKTIVKDMKSKMTAVEQEIVALQLELKKQPSPLRESTLPLGA